MATAAIDIREPTRLAAELAEANDRLAMQADVPADIAGLVKELAASLAQVDEAEVSAFDPYLLIALQKAALGAREALDLDDEAPKRREIRYRLEQMRHAFRDLASEEVVSDERPAKEIARWLADVVDVSQQRLAGLLEVEKRTFQRWISETETTSPEGDDARRLRVVARVVNQLRHSLTATGVIGWFEQPTPELDDRTPASLLHDPAATVKLVGLAGALRSSVAS
jgi:uncharacterized protein (DUF2384 family)